MPNGFYNSQFYPNYMNPQHQMANLVNQYPQYFNQQQAIQAQQLNQPSQISTQPPIMQPQNNRNSIRMMYVGNREEATATPVDLVNNTPTFFYNRGTNEVYLKQYDSTNGTSIFKTYAEIQPQVTEQPLMQTKSQADINYPTDELKSINDRLDVIYRILMTPQQPIVQYPIKANNIEVEIEEDEHKSTTTKGKKNA